MIAEERLYLTTDDRIVSEGDPDAAFLLCTPGEEIPEDPKSPTLGVPLTSHEAAEAIANLEPTDEPEDDAEKPEDVVLEKPSRRPAKKAPAK